MKLTNKIKNNFFKIVVSLQILNINLFANAMGSTGLGQSSNSNSGLSKLTGATDNAGSLFKGGKQGTDGGSFFTLAGYIIIFLGIIFMAIGINETFIAQDRGGENKK